MNTEKLIKFNSLIQEIKSKIQRIEKLNKHISLFNYKLESLLLAFDEVSINIDTVESDVESKDRTQIKDITINSITQEVKIPQIIKEEKKLLSLDELTFKILKCINGNELFKNNLKKFIKFLYPQENISFEEILKKSGVPKYRCIEFLNLLTQNEIQFITRTVENNKTFYILNKDTY